VDEKSLFAEFWSKESKTTSKVLARIPEDSDYRPDPKSRTAREIAWQIVGEEKMIIEALETGAVAWAPGPPPATMKELCDAYDRQRAEIVRRWQALAGAASRALGGHARLLGPPAADIADGMELSLRHRAPPGPDHAGRTHPPTLAVRAIRGRGPGPQSCSS
jgi:hypothetical protein